MEQISIHDFLLLCVQCVEVLLVRVKGLGLICLPLRF